MINLQKVTDSSHELTIARKNFHHSKIEIDEIVQKTDLERKLDTRSIQMTISKDDTNTIEKLNQLNLDLDSFTRETSNKTFFKDALNYSKEKYTVDKDIENLKKNPEKTVEKSKSKGKNQPKSKRINQAKQKVKAVNTKFKDKPIIKKTTQDNKSINSNTIDSSKTENTLIERISNEQIKNLQLKLAEIKNLCMETEKNLNENCIMENEKKNFEKLNNTILRISGEVASIKETFVEIKKDTSFLFSRLEYLEKENHELVNQKLRLLDQFEYEKDGIRENENNYRFQTDKITKNLINEDIELKNKKKERFLIPKS